MAHSSQIDDVQISGLNSKTAAEIVGLIRAEIDASRAETGEALSRPPETTRRSAFAASGQIWVAVGTMITTLALVLGIFQWQITNLSEDIRANSDSLRAEIGSVRAEIGSVRAEIGSLRAEIGAEIEAEIGSVREEIRSVREEIRSVREEVGSVREEVGSVREEVGTLRGEIATLRERIARVETLLLDRLPTSP